MGSNQPRTIRRLVALAGAATILVGACTGDDDDSAADEPAEAAEAVAADAEMADESADDSAGDARELDAIDLGQIGRDVIIEMDVTISSDDIERSVATLGATARRLGGGIASSEVDFGGDGDGDDGGFAVLVLKVPPETVDELLAGLDDVGTVESINQRAQDVTEQLVDLDVRIENARESVVNVREFMERAEDLTDLVTLEGELTRRQTDLERLEAQRRNLGERVALSTVTVQIVPTASIPDQDDDRSIGNAFADGWDAFVSVAAAMAYGFAATLPFLVVALIALAVWWWIRRRRHPATPDDATDATAPDDATATPTG